MGNAINDALANALRGLFGNAGGLLTGQNPIIQPQIASLIGFNIPATPLISTRDYFLTQLQSWISTPTLQSQWIALIDRFPPTLNSGILKKLEQIGGNSNAYNIDIAKLLLTSYPLQRVAGCIFCNSFNVPPESCSVESVAIDNNRGFVPGVISGKRAGYAESPLNLGFMDTNSSFVDLVLRPWVMLASHYGHVSRRDQFFSVKCNITLLSYGKTYMNVSMIPKKVFRFYNCVPITVPVEEFTYDEPGSVKSHTVNFSYTNYTVEDNLYLPLPQIIDSAKANVPFLSNPTTFQ
jgi:hypothetical protein